MNILKNPSLQHVMERIISISPRNIGEFYGFFEMTIHEISGIYGIQKVECAFTMPQGVPYAELGQKTIVISESETETEPICYQYPFEGDGKITFLVFVKEPKNLSEEQLAELKVFFYQFYQILRVLILSISFSRLITSDIATGIPNLKAFFQFAGKLKIRGQLGNYTALYFNIHNFKTTHKSLTYLEGNDVMEKYCQLVSNAVTKNEIVSRLGGDNFVALILDDNIDYFLGLIQNIVINYKKKGKELSFLFGATIGASKLTVEHDVGDIMMQVSFAYQAARETRVMLKYFDKSASQRVIEQKIILERFPKAIKKHEFFAVYQPKVDVKTNTIKGAEALVRWKQGDEWVSPGNFIPAFEKDGCVTVLDFYVLEEVCKFLKSLRSKGIEPVKISVNFSKRHLFDNKLVDEIVDIVDRYKVPHQYIEIELTESEDFHNNNVMRAIAEDLGKQGIQTSIDDFGTGYSSLSLLNTLRADELKLDRSFIAKDHTEDDGRSLIMLKGIISLAKELGFSVVAEGVETIPQLEIVNNMNCDLVQGYIFDKPLPADEFIERLKQRTYDLGKL